MKFFLVWLAFVLSTCEAYKILVIYPMPGKSHSLLGDGIVRHLLNDGHEVTYISAFPYEPASPNLRVIDVSANSKILPEQILNIEAILKKDVNLQNPLTLMNLLIQLPIATIQYKNVQKLLNDPKEVFDVVIAEWMFSELAAGFAAVFDCPLIWTFSVDIHWGILRLIDQPTNPSYTADLMEPNLPPFNFKERVKGLFTQFGLKFLRDIYYDRLEKQEYENLLAPIIAKRGRKAPDYYDLQYNASLVFANYHVSLGQAVAIPQNYIPIGGYHIDEDVKQLPNDLKKILDDSKNGAIYFSMGSNLKSKDLPKEIKNSLLTMFGGLQQTVLWKFEEDLPNKPKNVHILKWAPQQSILAHPNVILFITHGGLLSTTESVHFGVPIIGIPVFADQFSNVNRAERRGFALKVDLSYTMVDELAAAIKEMITNPRYSETVKQLSFIYHHRPVTPGKALQHWVKHVIQTRGAPHLRSPALHVPLYQKLYLDLLAIAMVTVFIIVKTFKLLLCAYCSKSKVNTEKKNN